MRYIKSLLFVVLTFIASSFNTVIAQNIGVHPTTLEFSLTNSQSETQVINLSNGSTKKVQFKLYLNDWIRDSLGGHIYYEPNTQPNSCSQWINLSKNFVELEPGQSTSVNVKMQVPDAADATKSMKWSMLFIETVQEQNAQASKGASATVNNLLRVGVHIYETPPSLTKKQMKVYALIPAPKSTNNTYMIDCQNVGEIMLECKAYIELTGLADGKKIKLDAVEFPTFPGQKRYIQFQLPANLPKGKYSALAVIDAGEDLSLEAVETNIEIK